ncbi:MAG TPA: nuclear transport factor 2 family protein [Candidatus Aquilonibacter sp.]
MTVPKAVADYLAADSARDPEGVAACFTPEAYVTDEAHTYRGRLAIASWKRETNDKYEYSVEPLTIAGQGSFLTMHARLTGTFPNSPVELDYVFTLTGDGIGALKIS